MPALQIKNRLFQLLHDGFRTTFPFWGRLFRLCGWEGDYWNRITRRIWPDGTITLSNRDHIYRVRPRYLTDLTAVFGRKEEDGITAILRRADLSGGVVVDVGAHIGRYSLLAAQQVGPCGRVLSFEPEHSNFKLLRQNCLQNGYDWVEAENYALGKSEGSVRLISGSDGAVNSTFEDWIELLQPDSEAIGCRYREVATRRLDSVLAEKQVARVDLLKIDVEGAELNVLHGSGRFLEARRIEKIICEVHDPVVDIGKLIRFVRSFGYETQMVGASEVYAAIRP